ncbi:glutamate receptor-interacting protein 2-like, partial [Pogonomyrmex barbatus]|uniref:Glutamate receptor-interacting protein 2-like n=1 Tax=Pogonomyrmex barbatus TaxID=144034 RepID=A0A8N1S974_9HYME
KVEKSKLFVVENIVFNVKYITAIKFHKLPSTKIIFIYTGSPADNADTLEVGDEILEVNGRTLENATHNEVIQYIHQCIKSRTICLRVRRRSGNKMEELDGPNAG